MTESSSVLLERHYATIGIDDVFVECPPHHFPSSYLSSSLSTGTSDGECGCLPFLSWEIVGSIKQIPEDFVVREIAKDDMPGSRTIESVSDKHNVERIRVADILSDDLHFCETKASKEYQCSSSVTVGSAIKETTSLNTSLMQHDAKLLEVAKVQKDEENLYSKSELRNILYQFLSTGCSADDVIQTLDKLSNAAMEALLRSTTKRFSDNQISSNVVLIRLIDNSAEDSSAAANSRIERGKLHALLRCEYPLLQAESISLADIAAHSDPDKSKDQVQGKLHNIKITIDDRFFDLIPMLVEPNVDLPALYCFFKRGYEATLISKKIQSTSAQISGMSCKSKMTNVILKLSADLPKEDRRVIHRILSDTTKGLLDSSTLTQHELSLSAGDSSHKMAAIAVRWSKMAEGRAAKKRKRIEQTITNEPHAVPIMQFVWCKTNQEHLAAIQILASALGCRPSDIGTAGMKDMRAVTYQFCTVRQIPMDRLIRARSLVQERNMDLGSICNVNRMLNRGDLHGNRFAITIRDLHRLKVEYQNGQATETLIPLDKHHLEKMFNRLRSGGFVNFYGEQRVGAAGIDSVMGVRSFDIGRALLQNDYAKAINLIMTGRKIIRDHETEGEDILRFREVWRATCGDVQAAWKALPRGNVLTRERMILKGLKRYGVGDPASAFRFVSHNERAFWVNAYQSFIWNKMASARIRLYGVSVVEGDLVRSQSDNVVSVASSDLSSLSIRDVVLPLPGANVRYPTNAIGDMYKVLIQDDGVNLSSDSIIKGVYRNLIAYADNLNFTVKSVFDKSDVSSVEVCFDLPKASYATSFLRELMLTTVTRMERYSSE